LIPEQENSGTRIIYAVLLILGTAVLKRNIS
jgi:hypothetical protein